MFRLRAPPGNVYLKVYRERDSFETEAHGYERWAPVFSANAPRLLGVRDATPSAILTSAIAGSGMDSRSLTVTQERGVWRDAGRALAGLHASATAERFGACARDGSGIGSCSEDPRVFIIGEFDDWTMRGERAGCLDAEILAVVRAARERIAVFDGEPAVPCHRDYGPANWLVEDSGIWTGVLDFEFSRWDVRVSDFSRYPGWEWMRRPDLTDALFEGYGRSLTAREAAQLRITRALYALGAVVWGVEHAFLGYAEEGREAVRHLRRDFG